eukprot:33844_1
MGNVSNTYSDAKTKVKSMKSDWGKGVSTLIIVYNNTNSTISRTDYRSSSGRFENEPPNIPSKQYASILHVKKSGTMTGSIGHVKYRVDAGYHIEVKFKWHTPYTGSNWVKHSVPDNKGYSGESYIEDDGSSPLVYFAINGDDSLYKDKEREKRIRLAKDAERRRKQREKAIQRLKYEQQQMNKKFNKNMQQSKYKTRKNNMNEQKLFETLHQKSSENEYRLLEQENGVFLKIREGNSFQSPSITSEQKDYNAKGSFQYGDFSNLNEVTDTKLYNGPKLFNDSKIFEISSSKLCLGLNIRNNDLIAVIYNGLARLKAVGLLSDICKVFDRKLSPNSMEMKSMQQDHSSIYSLNLVHILIYIISTGNYVVFELNNELIDPLQQFLTKFVKNKKKINHLCILNKITTKSQIVLNLINDKTIAINQDAANVWGRTELNRLVAQLFDHRNIEPNDNHKSGKDKELEILLNEFVDKNKQIFKTNLREYLQLDFRKYKKSLKELESILIPFGFKRLQMSTVKREHARQNIIKWCKIFASKNHTKKQKYFHSLVAVISIAIKMDKGWYPRDTQLLTVFLAFQREERRNQDKIRRRLFEVGTGEGKSVIVNMIVSIEKLYYGSNCDVVTSQNLLAGRDAFDQSQYYEMVLNTQSSYLDPQINSLSPERNEIYKNNPIYGTSFEYEADLLRDAEHNIRGNRDIELCTGIIDEVDNQFIDDILGSIRLSSPTAGMKEFNLIFIVIWYRLKIHLRP